MARTSRGRLAFGAQPGLSHPALVIGDVPAVAAIATAMTIATAIVIAITMATHKSCVEKVPKDFRSTELV